MSLINQMLRDLEARQSSPGSGPNPLAGLRSTTAEGATLAAVRWRWMGVAAAVALLVAGVLLLGPWPGGMPSAESRAVALAPPPTPPVSTPADTEAATSTRPAGADADAEPNPSAMAPERAAPPVAAASEGSRESDAGTDSLVDIHTMAAAYQRPPSAADEPTPAAAPTTPATAPAGPSAPHQEAPRASTRSAPPAPVLEARALQQRGLAARRRGDAVAAEALLRDALERDPQLVTARTELAELLIADRRGADAARLLDEGLRIAPGHGAIARIRARLLLDDGEFDAAAGLLRASLPPLAEVPDHYALLAATEQRRGRDADAAVLYRRLLGLRPDAGPWLVGLAISLERLGETAPAATAYRRALADPGLAEVLRRYAGARIRALES